MRTSDEATPLHVVVPGSEVERMGGSENMRFMIASMAVLGIAIGMSALPAPHWTAVGGGTVIEAAQQQPDTPGKVNIDVDINKRGGGGAWWNNPMWVAIGVIGIVLLVVIVAMIARGGGTTVIKEWGSRQVRRSRSATGCPSRYGHSPPGQRALALTSARPPRPPHTRHNSARYR